MLWLGSMFMVATLLVFGAIAYFSRAFGAVLKECAPKLQWELNQRKACLQHSRRNIDKLRNHLPVHQRHRVGM